jgi:tetratricopeptide (TPR) repeat protein
MKDEIERLLLSILLLFLAASSPLFAAQGSAPVLDDKLTRSIYEGMDDIYNLDYDRAAKRFEEMVRQEPKNPVGYTYLSFLLWIRELNAKKELTIDRFASPDFFSESKRFKVTVDPSVEREFQEMTQRAIAAAKAVLLEHDAEDPLALLMLGKAYGNLASFEATLKRSWWSAFRHGVQAHNYHRRLLGNRTYVNDVYQILGVSDYIAGSLPWKLRWVGFLLGHSGHKQRGKERLKLAAEKSLFAREDSKILLALIHTREGNFQQAYQYLEDVHKKYPKNYLLEMDMGGLAVLMRKYDLAEQIYRRVLDKVESREANYNMLDKGTVYNRLGGVYLRRGNYAAAADFFKQTIAEESSNRDSILVAHLQLGKTYDLLGRRAEAVEEYKKVLSKDDIAGSQDDARRYLEKPFAQ